MAATVAERKVVACEHASAQRAQRMIRFANRQLFSSDHDTKRRLDPAVDHFLSAARDCRGMWPRADAKSPGLRALLGRVRETERALLKASPTRPSTFPRPRDSWRPVVARACLAWPAEERRKDLQESAEEVHDGAARFGEAGRLVLTASRRLHEALSTMDDVACCYAATAVPPHPVHVVEKAADARTPRRLTPRERDLTDRVLCSLISTSPLASSGPQLTRHALLDALKRDTRVPWCASWTFATFKAALFGRKRRIGSSTINQTSLFPRAHARWMARRS